MAISVSNPGGGGRRSRSFSSMADINIIPLVDVVLVLLIIFILTAHVMEFGLEIEVPKTTANKASSQDLPIVSVTKTGEAFLSADRLNINTIKESIQKRHKEAKEVYVRADKETTWDMLAKIVDAVGKAGYKVLMVTQPYDEGRRR